LVVNFAQVGLQLCGELAEEFSCGAQVLQLAAELFQVAFGFGVGQRGGWVVGRAADGAGVTGEEVAGKLCSSEADLLAVELVFQSLEVFPEAGFCCLECFQELVGGLRGRAIGGWQLGTALPEGGSEGFLAAVQVAEFLA